MKLAILILIDIMILAGIQANAQDVTGQVYDQDGKPLPGVNIYLKSDLLFGTITEADGSFELNVPSGKDSLIVSFIGYHKKIIPLSIDQETLNIKLQPKETAMKELLIQGERLVAEGFDQHKIDRMDIYSNPAAKADPLLAVNALPAATNLDESANIRLRGALPHETAIFLDGVQVDDASRYGQLNGMGTFSIFNTSTINEVRVFPGSAPLEYGSNTSGLVAITSENQIPAHQYSEIMLSMANLSFNHTRRLGKNMGLRLFSNYQPSSLFINLNRSSLEKLKHFNSFDQGIQIIANPGNQWHLKIFNYTNQERYQYQLMETNESPLIEQTKSRNITIVNASRSIKRFQLIFNQAFSFSRQQFDFKRSNTNLNRQNYFGSLSLMKAGEKQEWKIGINIDLKGQSFRSLDYKLPYAIGPDHPMEEIARESQLNQMEFNAYRKRYLGEKVVLGSGLSINQQGKIGTNLMVNYLIDDHHTLRLTETSARRKFIADRFINQNYEIKADNLALEYIFKKNSHEFSIAGFWHRKEYAGDEVKVAGLEIYQQFDFGKLNLNWSFSKLNYREGIELHPNLENELIDLDYSLRGALNAELFGGIILGINALYRQGGQYFPVVNRKFDPQWQVFTPVMANQPARISDYFTIDLNTSKTFPIAGRWPIVAFASVNNILNHENISGYRYDPINEEQMPVLFSQRIFYLGFSILMGND